MLHWTLCANAPAIHADAAARTRVSAYVVSTFVMPSEGNLKDGAGLRGVRSSR
ncbi:MAG: hypothetical protein QOG90_539 [Actinomycetota bacterium]|jgi:hypothetical protein